MVIKVSVPKCFQFKVVPTIKNLMFFRQGDVHYIGGSDVLPPPLEPEECRTDARAFCSAPARMPSSPMGSSSQTAPLAA